MNERPAYMSKASLAAALDISESTVDEMVRRGVLPRPVRLSSGCIRWRWESVDAALASMMPGEAGQAADPYMQGVMNAAQEEAQRGRGGSAQGRPSGRVARA